jgi:L-arabinose isomerase
MPSHAMKELWFVTGSQGLYGPATLKQVARDSQAIATFLNDCPTIPARVVFKPVLTTPDGIRTLCLEANAAAACVGLITWMHTFSPAKMWIGGLTALRKPYAHLHTQFNRDIPWAEIDMDFMNLNQAAHGDREFGFMCSRLRQNRKVVVGYWQEPEVLAELGTWTRAALAWDEAQHLRVARIGDNMREVAVTEGDKVEAQIRLGFAVYGYGIGDLVDVVSQVTDREVDRLVKEYEASYKLQAKLKAKGPMRSSLREAARIELGLRGFLTAGNFNAFSTCFEDLHGMAQLPGLAVQRLMADGYGFGAEGDWKTAALVRLMKVMGAGLPGGASFMEDYTYHLEPGNQQVLGAHMLEICPSITSAKPSLECHPLGIGGKADPARLVFNVRPGPAVNAALMDMGNRFRLLINPVDVVAPQHALPKLPVARALWVPQPNLKVGAAAWILAGGAHHAGFSQAIGVEHLEDFAAMAGIEALVIDRGTTLREFQDRLRWNDLYYHLSRAL